MNSPKVSVIIPNYNYARFLSAAIDGVLAQTYPNIEIIVVDDGSSDESLEILRGYGDKLKLVEQANSGVSVARNRGVAESSGQYLAFLDADDLWLPEKLSRQVQMFEADETLGIVHVGVEEIDSDEKTIQVRVNGQSGKVWDELLLLKRAVILGGGSGIMLRREIFDSIGGFDTSLSTSADWKMFYSAARVSNVGFVPEVLVRYRIHGLNMHGNIKAMENDMTRCFDEIFSANEYAVDRDEQLADLRNEAYANMHFMLSGSYRHAGQFGKSVLHGIKSVSYSPAMLFRLLRKAVSVKGEVNH